MHSPRSLRLAGILVLAGALPAAGQAASVRRSRPADQERTDRLIVKFRDRRAARASVMSAADLRPLSDLAGVRLAHHRRMAGDAQVLRLPGKMPLAQVEALLEKLRQDPSVEYAEPDRLRQPLRTPNDPQYPYQWHYFAPASTAGGADLPAAWDITTGNTGSTVAVIDTGWLNHQDLAGRWVNHQVLGLAATGYCFITDANVANNAQCTPGTSTNDATDPGDWVTTAESNDPSGPFYGCAAENSSWHGTHVSGTIGAKSDNGIGVAGVNWVSKILPIRVLGKCGGYDSDIINGMEWAAGLTVAGYPANPNPAKVLSLSLGGTGACPTAWQNAIDAVTAAGSVVVVAAGNESVNLTFSPVTPASCSGVIAVAAVNSAGSLAYYSNYGSKVAISGPGGEQSYANDPNGVLSTLNSGLKGPVNVGTTGDTYVYYQGTSMATPHVSGVAALLFSINPNLTPAQVRQALQSTARPFSAGSGCNTSICGAGLLDAAAAVKAVLPAAPSGLTATALGVSSLTWTWNNSGAASYNFYYSTGLTFSNLAATSLTQVGLATNTAYGAAVSAIIGAEGPRSSTVTVYTLAAPPASFALVQVNASSLTVNWTANTNWGTTTYRVDYWQALGSTSSVTAQALSVGLTDLFGGATYYLTVSALNGDGVATSTNVISTVTLPSAPTTIGSAGGTITAGPATLQIFPGAYAPGQSVQVSLLAPSSLSGGSSIEPLAGTGIGLEVDLYPAIEPVNPVRLTMSYQNYNGSLDPSRFVIARYDAAADAWAPLPSKVDPANKGVAATVDHLSVFQIMQASPAADVFQFKIGPNPLKPSQGPALMKFVGPGGAQVRIYTLTGQLVQDFALFPNGTGSWDATNRAGRPVASGVYFVYVNSGGQSRTFKVIVER
ncbi:MAG: S8 family serine peptidase [Elusimicrobia bacterium]|nr:S8 family serine peptidase [Elusimicrobiota bacterium]